MRGHARGVRVIILYKGIKSGVQLVAAVVLLALLPFGLTERLHGAAVLLRHHAAQAWSLYAADWLVSHGTVGIHLTIVVLALDGVVSAFEGWSLAHGAWWGPWVVVTATGSLLPFEAVELARHVTITRCVIVVINLAIVLYLARRAWLERRARKSAPGSA